MDYKVTFKYIINNKQINQLEKVWLKLKQNKVPQTNIISITGHSNYADFDVDDSGGE